MWIDKYPTWRELKGPLSTAMTSHFDGRRPRKRQARAILLENEPAFRMPMKQVPQNG